VKLARPCKALESTVYAFVQVRTGQTAIYPIVPDGTNILFFSSCRESFGGTQSKILEIPLTIPDGEYFGIWFYPGAMRHFFNIDLSEASDTVFGLDFLEAPVLRNLHERIYDEVSFENRISLCERLLTKTQSNAGFIAYLDHALSQIYQSGGNLSVEKLADRVGCSSRHLNRIFQLHIGASIKAFSQMVRMNSFLNNKYRYGTCSSFPALSGRCDSGFFDQSHLIRSFKKQGLQSLSPFVQEFMSDFYNSK